MGGATNAGGTTGAGGVTNTGGTTGAGGATRTGGATGAGGATRAGGATGTGGATPAGGAGGTRTSTGSGGSFAGTGGSLDAATDVAATSSVIEQLKAYLAVPRAQRKPIDGEAFAQTPLSRDEAKQAADLLWQDYAANLKATRKAEHDARSFTVDGKTMRYAMKTFGTKPAQGRSLYLSLHGGGNADPSVNDEQWANQQTLYQPDEGIYLCPRAPTDTWNLWHEAHIDPMFERLITNLIVLEDVNPDRVYVMGYSAGGDGVYQLGPRMADHFAAAAAMAGHPNDAQPYSLRNIGFTIHVGALDTAYDRNLVAQQWSDQLDQLAAADPGGYPHVVQIHAGKPHWMDLEDAVAVPWMAKFTRAPNPATVVWYQDDILHSRFYWLAVDAAKAKAKTKVRAVKSGQSIALESSDVAGIKVRLADDMLDLDQPVVVTANGAERWNAKATRTIALLAKTLEERGDPRLVWSAEVAVTF
jgi:poly(3-hydroxybutyrate) depolymerase